MATADFDKPSVGFVTDVGVALTVTNDGGGGAISARSTGGTAILAETDPGGGPAVVGTAVDQIGVLGQSAQSVGVQGFSDQNDGVVGESASAHGVHGLTKAPTASAVRGEAIGPGGIGVHATSEAGQGLLARSLVEHGALGETEAENKAGVVGINNARLGFGVIGLAMSDAGGDRDQFSVGVLGEATVGVGVFGKSVRAQGVYGTSRSADGVRGDSESDTEAGVAGVNSARGPGVSGRGNDGPGVLGTTGSPSASGVDGRHDGAGFGVRGASPTGTGVLGLGSGGSEFIAAAGAGSGVVGVSQHKGAGVTGLNFNSQAGVLGWGGPGVTAMGGLASLGTTTQPAGGFIGDVTILGSLKVAGGSKQFAIDHPLTPETATLNHAAVEAPALKTFYDGTATADEDGVAYVELPAWFGVLNTDLSYQLTAIGGPAPELHIAVEYDGQGFQIGGAPRNGKVGWQVTGVRQDASARAHPLVVEQDKQDDERGTFLDADADRPVPWAARLLATARELEEHRQR